VRSESEKMRTDPWLHGALGLGDEETPFPWQGELVTRFTVFPIPRLTPPGTGNPP